MTEQEEIIQNFKDKCQEIITKHAIGRVEDAGFANDVEREITELANDVLNRHSNMPNIDIEKLKEDLYRNDKNYFNK